MNRFNLSEMKSPGSVVSEHWGSEMKSPGSVVSEQWGEGGSIILDIRLQYSQEPGKEMLLFLLWNRFMKCSFYLV